LLEEDGIIDINEQPGAGLDFMVQLARRPAGVPEAQSEWRAKGRECAEALCGWRHGDPFAYIPAFIVVDCASPQHKARARADRTPKPGGRIIGSGRFNLELFEHVGHGRGALSVDHEPDSSVLIMLTDQDNGPVEVRVSHLRR
jgi:hypothetical protein